MRLTARKRRKILCLTLLLIAVGVIVYLVLFNAVFRVREVRVEGNQTIDEATIMRAAQLPMGQKLSSINEESVRQALESGGLVELVSLEKNYPSEIVLTVRERQREAFALHAEAVLTMERDGTVIEKLSAMPEGEMVYVTGLGITGYRLGSVVNAPQERLEAMRAVLDALYENGATQYVSELDVSDENSIRIYSRTGMRVDLGDASNMGNKIVWMAGALDDLEARGQITGRLDVSSGNKADYSAQ